MRFFKIFLICLSSIIGVTGVVLGTMFLTGYFKEEVVEPTSIAFNLSSYEVTDNFEMQIMANEEGVTQTKVTLSFAEGEQISDVNGEITDGVIIIPKNVEIGVPFTVRVFKELQNLGGESVEWIKGGISTLKAQSENVKVRTITTNVFVDVPVHSLEVKTYALIDGTPASKFNVGSSFFAEANFIPAASAYRYSKNGTKGTVEEFKKIYFTTPNTSSVEMVRDSVAYNKAEFRALQTGTNFEIKAQAFSKVEDELSALESVKNITDPEYAKEIILGLLNSNETITTQDSALVEVASLVVGGFNVSALGVNATFNKTTRLYARKETLISQGFYNLGVDIIASDGETKLYDYIPQVAIALYVESQEGNVPLEPNNDIIALTGGRTFEFGMSDGKTYNFVLPNVNYSDIGASSWDIVLKTEDSSVKAMIVLFETIDTTPVLNLNSLDNQGKSKNNIDIIGLNVVRGRVYWKQVFPAAEALYIYDAGAEGQTTVDQYNLKQSSLGETRIVVPEGNSYQKVVYFAYIEKSNTIDPDLDLSIFLNVLQTPTKLKIGDVTTLVYEIVDGLVSPKIEEELPENYEIKVLFATVETNYNGSARLDEDGGYIIDSYSSDAQGNLSTLAFVTRKTIKNLGAHVEVASNSVYLDGDKIAIVHKTDNAFEIVFNLLEEQEQFFIRDWEQGRISLRFLIEDVPTNIFEIVESKFIDHRFSLVVKAGPIQYVSETDTGFRYFKIELLHTQGKLGQITKKVEKTIIYNSETLNVDAEVEQSLFELYDGLIKEITFAIDALEGKSSASNPFIVQTSLSAEQGVNNLLYENVPYASKAGSNNTISNSNMTDTALKQALYKEGTSAVNIIAKDKYGNEIKDETLWRLVSDDLEGKYLQISQSGQSINFLNATPENHSVKVGIETLNGIGGRKVVSSYSLYFAIHNPGKLVRVSTNEAGINMEDKYNYITKKNYVYDDATESYLISDFDDSFTDYKNQKIQVAVTGEKNSYINLTLVPAVGASPNVFQLFYALPIPGTNPVRYNVFDLLKTVSVYYDNDDRSIISEYVDFIEDEEGSITRLHILKNFGQKASLSFTVRTTIGLTFNLEINIDPVISGTPQKYGHDGAAEKIETNRYEGVYAQHELTITIPIEGLESIDDDEYTPIVYDASTKKVVAAKGVGANGSGISIVGTTVEITLYLEDVSQQTLRHLVFVLDTTGTGIDGDYQRNIFDFARDIYLNVNPNIMSSANPNKITNLPNENNKPVVQINVNQNVIENILGVNDDEAYFKVGRIEGERQLILGTQATSAYPFVEIAITDQNGMSTISTLFEIRFDGTKFNLHFKSTFRESASIYVTVSHKVSSQGSYIVGTYKIVFIPDITPNRAENNFVVYRGVEYLVLTAGTYSFTDDLAPLFTTQNEDISLIVNFSDLQPETPYWSITTQSGVPANIVIRQTNNILSDMLYITVLIRDVASITFPVIILPIQTPVVQYSLDYEDGALYDANFAVNGDLASLLSIDHLKTVGAYDIVEDASIISVFATEENPYGFFLRPNDAIFSLMDDPLSPGMSNIVAKINPTSGQLEIKVVGQDTFIIVVATINQNFKVYYRLKIKSSAVLKAFYPYADNLVAGDKAEYLYFMGAQNLTVDFTVNSFTADKPATKQTLAGVYVGEELQENYFITKRFEMFRQIRFGGENGLQTLAFTPNNILSISIKQIQLLNPNTWAVESNVVAGQFANYVVFDGNNLRKLVFKNVGTYKVVLTINTDLYASVDYTIIVKDMPNNYSLSTTDTSLNLNAKEIELDSPTIVDEQVQSDILKTFKLTLTRSGIPYDNTNELKFFIYNSNGKLFVDEDNNIQILYSPNIINARLAFYTRFGLIDTFDIVLNSLIDVVDPENQANKKYAQNVYGGQDYNFEQELAFIEKEDETLNIIEVLDWKVFVLDSQGNLLSVVPNILTDYTFENGILSTKFTILPVKQTQTLYFKIVVTLPNSSQFEFDFTLTVLPALEATGKTNSSELITHELIALEEIELYIFNNNIDTSNNKHYLYINNGVDLEVRQVDGEFFATSQSFTGEYFINISPVTGSSVIADVRLENGVVIIATNAVAFDTRIVLRVTVSLDTYFMESFIAFNITPDAIVETFYPELEGLDIRFESIYYDQERGGINLLESPSFQSEPRVKIESLDGKNKTEDAYVTYRVVSGEQDSSKFEILGGSFITGTTNYSLETSKFTFGFKNNPTYDFAEVEFEIYVSGISRAKYIIKVYSKISSVYSVKVNNINEVEGANSELFYLGEDRRDIFNGAQAIRFTVAQTVNSNIKINMYKSSANTNVFITSFQVGTADRRQVKTIKMPMSLSSSTLADLTQNNVKFKFVNAQDQESTVFYTLQDLTNGTNGASKVFELNTEGNNSSFVVMRRLVVTYLGVEINDTEFLNEVKVSEDASSVTPANFRISYEGLGDDVTVRSASVGIYIGDTTDSNSLGTYSYVVKANFQIQSQGMMEFMVGQNYNRLLSQLGIKKLSGENFVNYDANGNPIVSNVLLSKQAEIKLDLKTKNDFIEAYYADRPTVPYEIIPGFPPVTRSTASTDGPDEVVYDFNLMPFGAPNGGLLVTLIFTYKFDNGNNTPQYEEAEILFRREIQVKIVPNWNIRLLNQNGIENSLANPERISANDFAQGSNLYNYIFAEADNVDQTKVLAYKLNVDVANQALQLNYTLDTEYSSVASIVKIASGGIITKVSINLTKPLFAERKIIVKIADNFGYSLNFYFVVEPQEVINYESGLAGGKVFEGDKLIIQHSATQDDEGIDHTIHLNKQTINNNITAMLILRKENGDELALLTDDFVSLDTPILVKYLDGSVFSQTQFNVYVYIEILLKDSLSGEIYTVNTVKFFLYQRYTPVVQETKVRDGNSFNLINYIAVEDKKLNTPIGVPTLENDRMLYIKRQNFNGYVVVSPEGLVSKTINISDNNYVSGNNGYSFISLKKAFPDIGGNIANYVYKVTEISDSTSKVKFAISGKNLTYTVLADNPYPTNSYVVYLFDGYQYYDVEIGPGATKVLPNEGFSILGYDISASGTIMYSMESKQVGGTSKQYIYINNSSALLNAEIRLTTTVGQNQLVIKQSSSNPALYSISNGTFTIPNQMVDEDGVLELEAVVQGQTISFVSNGENWIITGYSIRENLTPHEFRIVNDKKLKMVTIDTSNSGTIKEVDVIFAGVDQILPVKLNKNDTQEFSMLEVHLNKWNKEFPSYNANYISFADSPIRADDLTKVKGLEYYNDTLEVKVGPSSTATVGRIALNITRVRGTQEITKSYEIPVYNFAYTYNIGISYSFKDYENNLIKDGDIYRIQVVNLPTRAPSYINFVLPNGSVINNVQLNDVHPYTVVINDLKVFEIVDDEMIHGQTSIKLDSSAQFNYFQALKYVGVDKYYVIGFNGVLHVLNPVNYQVSPYYFGIDTSKVYEQIEGRGIDDYRQGSTEPDGTVPYYIDFDTWASNVALLASSQKPTQDTLSSVFDENYLRFAFNSGAGAKDRIDENGNITIYLPEGSAVTTIHLEIDVQVAVNGAKNVFIKQSEQQENIEWIGIGSIRLVFNTYPQYRLESQAPGLGYVVATVDNSAIQDQDIFVKYIEIKENEDANSRVAFSVNRLFESNSLTIKNVLTQTTTAEHKGLSRVYLTSNEEKNYQVSFSLDGKLNVNAVLTSEFIRDDGLPTILGANIVPGGAATLELKVINGGQTTVYTGNYTNNSNKILFSEIALSSIIASENGKTFKDIIETAIADGHTFEIIPVANDKLNVSVVWTKLDLTQIASMLSISFFGDATPESATKYDKIITILKSSKLFKLTPISSASQQGTIEKVWVEVAGKTAAEIQHEEFYAVTQSILSGGVLEKAQTVVVKAVNTSENIKEIQLNVPVLVSSLGAGNYTSIVLVEKLDKAVGIKGPTLINANGFYSFELGVYIKENSMISFESELSVIKQENPDSDYVISSDLSTYYKGIENVFLQSNGLTDTSGLTQYAAAIIVKKLTEIDGNENETEVEFNISVPSGKVTNIISYLSTSEPLHGTAISRIDYTYEYVSSPRTVVSLKPSEIKMVYSKAGNANSLLWHELTNKNLPTGKFFYNITRANGTLEVETSENIIENLNDKDVVSYIWDGLLLVENLENAEYLQLTYNGKQVYFDAKTYRHNNTSYIDVSRLFDEPLNRLEVSAATPLDTKLKDIFTNQYDTIKALRYEFDGQVKTYALVNYADAAVADALTQNLFDIFFENDGNGKNAITVLYKDEILALSTNFNENSWTLPIQQYYSFKQGNVHFATAFISNVPNYNLFTLFNTNIIFAKDGEVEIARLKNSIDVLADAVIIGDPSQFGAINVLFEFEGQSVAIFNITINLIGEEYFGLINIGKLETLYQNLTSNVVSYIHIDEEGNEVANKIFARVENYSLVDQVLPSFDITTAQ